MHHIRVQEQGAGVICTSLVHHPRVINLVRIVEVTFIRRDRVAFISRVETVDRTAGGHRVADVGTHRGRDHHVGDLGVEALFSGGNQLLVQERAKLLQGHARREREVTQTSVSQRTVERLVSVGSRGGVVAIGGSQVQDRRTIGIVARTGSCERIQRTKTATVVGRSALGSGLTRVLDGSTVSTNHLQLNVKHDFGQLLDFLVGLGVATSLFHSTSSTSSTDNSRENLGVVAQVGTGVRSSSTRIHGCAFQFGVQSRNTEVVVGPNVQGRVDLALLAHSHVRDRGAIFHIVRNSHVKVFDHDVGCIGTVTITESGRCDSCHVKFS